MNIKHIKYIGYSLLIALTFSHTALANDRNIDKRISLLESHQDTSSLRDTYTLQEAIDRALVANPHLAAISTQVKSAQYDVRNAYSAFVPTVVASGSAMYTNGTAWSSNALLQQLGTAIPATGFANLPDISKNSVDDINLSWSVTAIQPLFPLTMLSQLKASKLAKESQELQFEHAQMQLVSTIQTTFIDFIKFNDLVRVNEGAIERSKEQLALVRASHRQGMRTRLDVLQSEVDLAGFENTLIQVKDQRELIRASLQALLALPVTSSPDFSGILAAVPFEKNLEECLATAMLNRPELRLGRLAVSIAETGEKISASNYFPQINLQGGYSETGEAVKEGGDTRMFAVGLNVQWEVFSGGRTVNGRAKAKLATSQALYTLMDSTNHVANSVKALYFSVHEARKRIELTQKTLKTAQDSYKAAKMSYELGMATNLDLLYAQLGLTNEENNHSTALADYLRAIAQLYTAMGDNYSLEL